MCMELADSNIHDRSDRFTVCGERAFALPFSDMNLVFQTLLFDLYLAGNINSRSDVIFLLHLLLLGGLLESAYILVLAGVGHDFAIIRTIGLKSVLVPRQREPQGFPGRAEQWSSKFYGRLPRNNHYPRDFHSSDGGCSIFAQACHTHNCFGWASACAIYPAAGGLKFCSRSQSSPAQPGCAMGYPLRVLLSLPS